MLQISQTQRRRQTTPSIGLHLPPNSFAPRKELDSTSNKSQVRMNMGEEISKNFQRTCEKLERKLQTEQPKPPAHQYTKLYQWIGIFSLNRPRKKMKDPNENPIGRLMLKSYFQQFAISCTFPALAPITFRQGYQQPTLSLPLMAFTALSALFTPIRVLLITAYVDSFLANRKFPAVSSLCFCSDFSL